MSVNEKIIRWLWRQGFCAYAVLPDERGAAINIIAVKDEKARALLLADFPVGDEYDYDLLTEAQASACEAWLASRNTNPIIVIIRENKAFFVLYKALKRDHKRPLDDRACFDLTEGK